MKPILEHLDNGFWFPVESIGGGRYRVEAEEFYRIVLRNHEGEFISVFKPEECGYVTL